MEGSGKKSVTSRSSVRNWQCLCQNGCAFRHGLSIASAKRVAVSGAIAEIRIGAFESYQKAHGNKGVKSDVSCACHWAVNQASSENIGRMWRNSYVATPGGIMVPPDSPITRPEQFADRRHS